MWCGQQLDAKKNYRLSILVSYMTLAAGWERLFFFIRRPHLPFHWVAKSTRVIVPRRDTRGASIHAACSLESLSETG